MKKFLVFVDYTDGYDRESWSPWYCDIYVADTEEEAEFIGAYTLGHSMNDHFDEEGYLLSYGDVYIRQEGQNP